MKRKPKEAEVVEGGLTEQGDIVMVIDKKGRRGRVVVVVGRNCRKTEQLPDRASARQTLGLVQSLSRL